MKSVLKLILAILISGTVAFTGVSSVSAITLKEGVESMRCDTYCPASLFDEDGFFRRISNIIISVVSAIAIIMLIVGGIKYVVSGGDSKKVTDAKNTLLYAIIGLVVCIISFAIIQFVLTSLASGGEDVTKSVTEEAAYLSAILG